MGGTKNQKGNILHEWRAQLQKGDSSWLDDFYLESKGPFEAWCEKHYSLGSADVQDVYHNAVMAMYENIFYNRIGELSSSPKTYMYGIAKNLIMKGYRSDRVSTRHENRLQEHWHFLRDSDEPTDHRVNQVTKELEQTKSPCKELIELFYIEGLSLAAISEKLGYESPEVAKTQKSRCMKTFRRKIFNDNESD